MENVDIIVIIIGQMEMVKQKIYDSNQYYIEWESNKLWLCLTWTGQAFWAHFLKKQ